MTPNSSVVRMATALACLPFAACSATGLGAEAPVRAPSQETRSVPQETDAPPFDVDDDFSVVGLSVRRVLPTHEEDWALDPLQHVHGGADLRVRSWRTDGGDLLVEVQIPGLSLYTTQIVLTRDEEDEPTALAAISASFDAHRVGDPVWQRDLREIEGRVSVSHSRWTELEPLWLSYHLYGVRVATTDGEIVESDRACVHGEVLLEER